MSRPLFFTTFSFFLFLLPVTLAAQESTEESTEKSRRGLFEWHGYVNLGYGTSSQHKYRGIPTDGTIDLHTLALQMAYRPTERDAFVIQLANERVGTSPSNEFREDLELDWLFYRRNFATGTHVSLGRIPLPVGIYNAVKDVGVLLPFYRPSGVFYGDGTWTSDYIDGLVISHSFFRNTSWSVDGDFYYGEWERLETDGNEITVDVAKINDAYGFWLWLNTPMPGLRLGLGANRFEAEGGAFLPPGATDQEETRYISVDVDIEPVRIRFEYSKRTFTGGHWNPFYLELDTKITERFSLAAMYESGKLLFEIPFFATFDDKIEELYSLGLRFTPRADLVFKLEHQWYEGYGQIEDLPLNIFFDEPVKTQVLIFSASMTF